MDDVTLELIKELKAQIEALNSKLAFYEAKIRRLECEVREGNAKINQLELLKAAETLKYSS